MAELVPRLITLDVMHRIIGPKDCYSLADARKLHKNQYTAERYRALTDNEGGYSPDRMLEIFKDRARYVIRRGATLNNPHIPLDYFDAWPTITDNHAAQLRDLVKNWLDAVPPQQIVRDDMP